MLKLERIKRTDPRILPLMARHYSAPKGFVGRNICYAVLHNGTCYGAIVGGSATRFLPGRNEFVLRLNANAALNNIINNIFYHVEPQPRYPMRNFTTRVLEQFRYTIAVDWQREYGDPVAAFETLIELPRVGETYLRDGWIEVGQTVGNTCKRTGGDGTDSWTGKRVWDTQNLRPKRVLCRQVW